MGVNAIGAIGLGDEDKKSLYRVDAQKRKPWEEIGSLINGFGSMAVNLPANFNSAFAVGKGGTGVQGAFRG